jgi:uncharacterized protein (DUF1501 family)
MLDVILGRASRRCDGLSRRDFLRVGALGGLGLTLPALLRSEARGEERRGARAKSIILVYLGGGMSHHDGFDPKPDAPVEVRGQYKAIPTCLPGVQLSEKLPLMAQCLDKISLVRSGSHNNDHHETATNWALCGRFGSAFGDYPAMGAVVAYEMGVHGQLPPYVAVPRNPSFTWELGKSAYLGGRYESFKAGDPNEPNYRVQDVSPNEDVTAKRAERRKSLLGAVDDLARQVQGNDQIATYDEFHERAATMLLSSEARGAFAIEAESDRLRERYGRTTFGQSCLLGRRLIERGVRFVTINYGGWDHHAKIFDSLNKKLPEFDQGLSALLEDLDTRGLLAETMVLAFGEFGRSPKVNKDAGRDHWGPAASLVFAGGGVTRGQVVGSTDKMGGFANRRPVAPADVACTVYEALGIDPRNMLPSPDGRPIQILDAGETIKELYA